jgi:hypothetical protein
LKYYYYFILFFFTVNKRNVACGEESIRNVRVCSPDAETVGNAEDAINTVLANIDAMDYVGVGILDKPSNEMDV